MNALNNYASATPALDGEQRLRVLAGRGRDHAGGIDHDGREVWTAKLPGNRAQHGIGSSPIVHRREGDSSPASRTKGGGDIPSAWFALDRKTGQIQWRYEHPENANASYSTPCVYRDKQGRDRN